MFLTRLSLSYGPSTKAQGTSIAALLAPVGVLAFWEYHKAGNVDLKAGLLIALGFTLGGYFGGQWAQHISELLLRRIFGTLVVIIGIRLLLADKNTLRKSLILSRFQRTLNCGLILRLFCF